MALRRKLNAVIKNYVRLIVITTKPAFSQWQITIWLFCYLENQTMTAFRAKPQTLLTPPSCRVAASPTLFRKSHSVKKTCLCSENTVVCNFYRSHSDQIAGGLFISCGRERSSQLSGRGSNKPKMDEGFGGVASLIVFT